MALGADYPNKPINLLIGYAAGGSTDLTTRALASEVGKTLKQPVICSNQVGASGTLVLGRVKGEKADGYTIYNAPTANFCRIPHLQAVPYDPLKDFAFIMQYGLYQYGIIVGADSPWNTLEELLEHAKKNPSKIKYATSGLGSGQHLVMEYLAKRFGIKWDHVPFAGGVQAVAALLGGHVHVVSQTRPIALIIMLVILALLILPLMPWVKQKREALGEIAEDE